MPVLRQFSHNPQTRSNEEFIFIRCGKNKNTVQTSWRPQLPLPKELDDTTDEQNDSTVDGVNMERSQHHHPHHHHNPTSHANSRKDNSLSASQSAATNHQTPSSASNKKWSFGRLFRRKKEIASDSSSEEDRKAGFIPSQRNTRAINGSVGGGVGSCANLKPKSCKPNKLSRSSKLNGTSFDHIAINPQTGARIAPPHPPQPQHVDHEFFLPVETISPTEAYYQNLQQQYHQHGDAQPAEYTRSANSLDRRAAHAAALKTRSAHRLPHEKPLGAHSSSEEELISLNSSTFSKYRSDESIHSGGLGGANNAQSKRSRAARNERYYKRLSRDGEPSNGQVPVMYAPQPTQRWKTQPVPLSIYNPSAQALPPSVAATPRLRNTSSLQHVAPYVQWGQLQQQPKNLQNTVTDGKRSISYDSHIHLQNINGRQQTKPLPPPPPPRDPLRRVNVSAQSQNGSVNDLRPISYAFDQSGMPLLPATSQQRLSGRCVSDDKIWSGPAGPHYQSVHSLNTPPTSAQHMQSGTTQHTSAPSNTAHHRRFITRAERDAHPAKKSLPNGIEFHYVADATPRSRKPIHMLEPRLDAASGKDPSTSTSILRTTKSGLPSPLSQQRVNEFWKRLDAGAQRRGRDIERAFVPESSVKPRSISSSRVGELRAYPIPVYSEVQKPQKKPQPAPQTGVDEVDGVVCGSLRIKSKPDNSNSNYVEIRNKDSNNKSNSMPNHYQRRSGEIPNTPNKYDEYVAEKREQHHKPIFTPPTPPQRKLSIPPSSAAELPVYFPRKKPANLEEAINELEAIYKSLGLTEEPEKKERVPTPSEFEKFALAHADDYDDEDSPTGEPDPIRDDVAYRNMQLANLQHKTVEKQPPFGIPIGPVVAAPQNDYLHVTPIVEPSGLNSPDIVKDDLAVRALRKDPPGPKDSFIYPYSSFHKKNRATRTQSANIYNLIHRDAAKPSGGDFHSYLELTRNLDRAGSMSDLHRDDDKTAADVPTTLALLRNLKEQDQQQQPATPKKISIPFRHPSQGGAICALPEKLPSNSVQKEEVHKPPVPLPRKSLTPEPTAANAQMEDALNKIAMEAKEKSVKLTKELQELRKEALITASRPKANSEEEKLEQDLQEIEAVSEAAKRCGKMLLDTLPDANESQALPKPRKLHKEGKLIEAIDQVSEAANAVCEKILKDIVTTEPPVVVHEAVQVKNKQQTPAEALVMPNLIKKLDPIKSEQIEAIAKRCMRQLSELADDNPDYDNLNQELQKQQQSAANGPAKQPAAEAVVACNAEHIQLESAAKVDNLVSTVAEVAAAKQSIEEIDQIMQECEAKVRAESTVAPKTPPIVSSDRTLGNTTRQLATTTNSSGDDHTTAPSMTTSSCSSSNHNVGVVAKTGASTTASSFSSSSDCLAKSSSPSAGRRQSSSITSFNPYSSSDYIKSPSSEYHAPSTDPIKSFSTTSYEGPSSASATANISLTTNSTFSYSPSPPLNLTPVSARATTIADQRRSQERTRTRSSSSPSQYNSSEELAMIFGIDEQPRRQRTQQQKINADESTTNVTESVDTTHSHNTTSRNENSKSSNCSLSSASATAKSSCQPTSIYDKAKHLQQQQPPHRLPSKQQSQQKTGSKSSTRYQGVHPHFHHHTAPAYYTDVNLHIHTPKANDVAALNENYQSVYSTTSKLVNERHFPKTSTATVVPPPIGTGTAAIGRANTTSPTAVAQRDRERILSPVCVLDSNLKNSSSSIARAAFFRGGSANSSGNNERKGGEHFSKSSPAFGRPVKKGNTSASASASASSRSRHSNRFAGKKRAVRVRSESRPISALYDIICKEKGLDIGTSTTNEDDSSTAPSNDDDEYQRDQNKRSNNSKERNCQRSGSRNSNRRNSNDYTEISNCLTAFVANSLSNYLGGSLGQREMDNTATVSSASGDAKAGHDRSKRSHKSRTPNSQKSGYKKRKDLGKSKTAGVMRSASDEELNGETSEDSNERRAHAMLSPRSRKRIDCCRTINGMGEKASSLPPRLHSTSRTGTKHAPRQHKATCPANADSNTYPIARQCPVHRRCNLECEYQSSNAAHRPPHYPLEYHQSSLPPNLSSDPCSSIRSPSTVDDNSIMVVNNLGYSPEKLYIEPVTLSGMPSGTASGKNANSSSSGVVVEQGSSTSSAWSIQRISRAQQRRLREEMRRHTDLPQLCSHSPTSLSSHLGETERALSEDEGVAGVKQQSSRTSKAKRFINRPSRTPSRGRTGNSVNGSPHPTRRNTTTNTLSESSSSAASPAAPSNRRSATTNDNNLNSPTGVTPPTTNITNTSTSGNSNSNNTVTTTAAVTIEDVGSASSGDHIAHIKLSPLQIMTNSATPATELRPPANGSVVALDADEAHPAESEMHAVNEEETGTADIGVQVAISDKKKYEDEPHQRSRSPCYGSPISPRSSASPKHQSPRLSISSSSTSDNQRVLMEEGSESVTKLVNIVSPKVQSTSSPTTIENLQSATENVNLDATSTPTLIADPQSPTAVECLHATSTTAQSSSSSDSPTAKKKLVPTVSVSVKQNLSEMQFNGDINASDSPKKLASSKLRKPRATTTPSTECTAKFTRSAGRLSTAEENDSHLLLKTGKSITRPRPSPMKSGKSKSTNDLKPNNCENSPSKQELSAVNGVTPDSPMEDRDKSSKRKSNLNRSLNDEATVDSDDSLAARRRRRRELGLVRQLVPSDDLILREMLLPHQNKLETSATTKATPGSKSSQPELAYHMEIARRGWDLVNQNVSNRARSETANSKYENNSTGTVKEKSTSARPLTRRSDTLHLGELRKLRSNDVNRKFNERTKSDLAEIKKIAEQANVEMAMMASGIATELAEQAVHSADYERDGGAAAEEQQKDCVVELATPARYGMGSRGPASTLPPPTPSYTEFEMAAEAKERDPSPAKHATFVQEERIYYDPEISDQVSKSMASGLLRQRMLKARSMERDAGHEPPKLSPILRRRSTDDPTYIAAPTNTTGIHSTSPSTMSHNHIVSILKKKDHIAGESSSASSNASPVTFSANVVDTPTTKQKRAGILKKRSSLDESRYYSRSHSPDERSILIKSARRNSLEETAGLQQQQQHGILKQSSYESSKSDGCPSATEPHPHGILKKKDSTSTPSDGGTHAPKHVSISQAVKMAAAELGRETADSQFAAAEYEENGYTPNNEEYEIRPILKLESASSDDAMRPPKPILKKKSSGDSDEYEIRPILKTSRKSSREEFDLGGSQSEDGRHYSEPPPPVRPILKTDSPSKRRSLGGEELEQVVSSAENGNDSPSLLKRRTRSLERQEPPVVDLAAALNAIATSQAAPVEFVTTPITTVGSISVAERIKNMEKFLSTTGGTPSTPPEVNSSWESPLQAGITPRLLKPSAIRRDMYRDRYKTQPVTNDEKLLFKATASPLDTSATSAFKPTKSLDAGLNYTAFAHSNAPSNTSSVSSSGSSYTLTRCATQPLNVEQHYFNAAAATATGASSFNTPPLRAAIGRLNSLSDSYNNSISEQLTLSAGSDSERIFDMSGIEEPESATTVRSECGGEPDVDGVGGSGGGGGGGGLLRRNSVRARANMFQQLQEKTKGAEAAAAAASATAAMAISREEGTSLRRAPHQLSPTSALPATPPTLMSSSSITSSDDPKTPQNPPRTDEEIEPTSLPVSERLRFFTNLTEAASRSASSSYTRSPPQRFLSNDRCGSANSYNNHNSFTFTPRSSYNGSSSTGTSSASVTPTPMECYSPPLIEPQLISINEIDTALQMEHNGEEENNDVNSPLSSATHHETSAFIKLTKSSSQTLLPPTMAQRLAMPAPAPTTAAAAITSPSMLTPVARRVKMKTIGKLLLPQTFLNNERNSQLNNNNNNMSDKPNGNIVNGNDTCDSECSSIESNSKPPPVKKIGKIKSPFIENCLQMQQKHHQVNSKCMKYDHKSTPHNNALTALENNVNNGGAAGERDVNALPARKPLQQNGNAGLPSLRVDSIEDNNTDSSGSGKENTYCDTTNVVPLLALSPTNSSIGVPEQLHSPVVEMRKKFSRIISNSSLTTMPERHTAHAIGMHDSGSANLKANSSSAPSTPRNSIIDEKFAKYFGISCSKSNSHSQKGSTTASNKALNGSEYPQRERAHSYVKNTRLHGAGEKYVKMRHALNNYPPLPPPDFGHTTNGESHCDSNESELMSMETSAAYNVYSGLFEALNPNVRSKSNISHNTPPIIGTFETSTPASTLNKHILNTPWSSAATSSGTTNAVQKRRDMAKRQRANTTNVTFTPTKSEQVGNQQANMATPSAGRARVLRARALTLTHGVPLPMPEVKRFEDIVVTKEEFQLASKEFERIFLGII